MRGEIAGIVRWRWFDQIPRSLIRLGCLVILLAAQSRLPAEKILFGENALITQRLQSTECIRSSMAIARDYVRTFNRSVCRARFERGWDPFRGGPTSLPREVPADEQIQNRYDYEQT